MTGLTLTAGIELLAQLAISSLRRRYLTDVVALDIPDGWMEFILLWK